MKSKSKLGIATALLGFGLVLGSCGPATQVTVGVGVMYPGPWVGPVPGGVVVGRPYPGPYYPLQPGSGEELQLVWEQKLEASLALDDSSQAGNNSGTATSDSLESLR